MGIRMIPSQRAVQPCESSNNRNPRWRLDPAGVNDTRVPVCVDVDLMFEIAGDSRQMDGIDMVPGENNAAERAALTLGAEFELIDAMELQPADGIPSYGKTGQRDGIVEELHLVSRAQVAAKRDCALPRPHAVAPRQINYPNEEQADQDTVQFHRLSIADPKSVLIQTLSRRRSA